MGFNSNLTAVNLPTIIAIGSRANSLPYRIQSLSEGPGWHTALAVQQRR